MLPFLLGLACQVCRVAVLLCRYHINHQLFPRTILPMAPGAQCFTALTTTRYPLNSVLQAGLLSKKHADHMQPQFVYLSHSLLQANAAARCLFSAMDTRPALALRMFSAVCVFTAMECACSPLLGVNESVGAIHIIILLLLFVYLLLVCFIRYKNSFCALLTAIHSSTLAFSYYYIFHFHDEQGQMLLFP
jgi:hypothetical protein